MPGYEGGFTSATNSLSYQQQAAILNAMRQMQMAQQMRQQQARQGAGQALYGMFGGMPPPGIPAPPGTVAGGPQPLPPGTASPARQPGPPSGGMPLPPMAAGAPQPAAGPVPVPPAAAAPPVIPPFKPMPGADSPANQPNLPQPGAGAIPPPPAAAAPVAPAGGETTQQRAFNIPNLIQGLQKSGVPAEKVMDMLDELLPVMNSQNQAEVAMYRAHNAGLQAAVYAYQAETRRTRADEQRRHNVEEETRKKAQGDERNRIQREKLEKKLHATVGGADKLKRTEFEKDADGNIIGVVGTTNTGKIVRLDMEGNPRTGPGGSPKADINRLRQTNAWRAELGTLENSVSKTPADKARIEELKRKLREGDKAGGSAAAGGGDIQAKLKAQGLPYEPDKYYYRVNPTSGQLEKKAKGG